MAQLAIKGHADRGEEVIKILELLGGKNPNCNVGKYINIIYFINNNGYIEATSNLLTMLNFTVLTLEEFLEKYPYKVGDKVIINGCDVRKIHSMYWDRGLNRISYILENHIGLSKGWGVNELQPAEETIKDMAEKDKVKAPDMKGEDYVGKRFGYKIPDGYEFDTVYNGEIILKLIKPQYPKTYKECCVAVNASPYVTLVYDKSDGQTYSYDIDNLQIYENLRKIKICRDAYWKIAGEQMELDKSWEPDWKKANERKYCIVNTEGNITKWVQKTTSKILAFPTEEMRDAFYENFKDLIEECKELL